MGAVWRQLLVIALGGACVLGASCASAQITPDRTLPNNSSVTINGSVFNITGGTQAGRNLFHSFQQFSVPTNNTAFFNNGLDIQNIISRVTGGSVSNIDGLIKANGTANLFFLNPNGIVFGKNASLNIGGSFVASTSNSIKFADGFEFSATAPSDAPLLTISVPIGLQYGANPRSITTNQSVLQVPSGNTLALVGGDVSLNGGGLTAAGGRVELGGLAGAGTVGLETNGNTFRLNFPSNSLLSNVTLADDAQVDVLGNGGGDIAVNTNIFTATNGGLLFGGTEGTGNGGDITVNSNQFNISGVGQSGVGAGIYQIVAANASGNAGNITVNTNSFNASSGVLVGNSVLPGGMGNAGDIKITSGSLAINSGADISGSTFGQGNAGSVFISAKGSVSLDNGYISSNVGSGAVGNGGSINISAASLSLNNGAQLNNSIFGQGNAGNVIINATNGVSLFSSNGQSASIITSTVGSVGSTQNNLVKGNGGNIEITTDQLSLSNGAQLRASTYGVGDAGSVIINALKSVSFDGGYTNSSGQFTPSGIFSTVGSVGSTQNNLVKGNGGNIEITTDQLSLSNGALFEASTYGVGDAGSVIINAMKSVSFDGGYTNSSGQFIPSGIFSTVGYVGNTQNNLVKGNGGNIEITTDQLSLSNGALFVASTYGVGNAGSVTIAARDSVSLSNGAQINSNATGTGNAGNILVQAQDTISLAGINSGIFSNIGSPQKQPAFGNVGNIELSAKTVSLTDEAQLQAGFYSGGQGNPGIVSIKATDSISFAGRNSGIFSNVDPGGVGNGSDIQISAKSVSFTDGAVLDANNAGRGNGGNITISDGALSLSNSLISTETASSGNGGNIILNLSDYLLLRNGSLISTTAGTASSGGNGGNITINTPFVIAFPLENSDITANAFSGSGGRVSINATNLFNIAPLSRQDLEKLLGTSDPTKLDPQRLPTNDITAVSQQNADLSGTVQINTPDIDPTRGLVTLPTVTENTPKPISSSCAAFNELAGGSNFTITGRGGLPPSPDQPLTSDVVWTDTRLPTTTQHQHKTHAAKPKPQPVAIVPATGWVFNGKGEVTLISRVSNATTVNTPTSCPTR